MKTRRGRGIAALLVVAIAALATASVAWACTLMVGQTYIDGHISYPTGVKKGGIVPRIGAKNMPTDFGPEDGTKWSLRAGKSGCCSKFSYNLTDNVLHTLNRTDSDGWQLGQVDGKAPSGPNDQGTWKVCFLDEVEQTYATDYASFTVN